MFNNLKKEKRKIDKNKIEDLFIDLKNIRGSEGTTININAKTWVK